MPVILVTPRDLTTLVEKIFGVKNLADEVAFNGAEGRLLVKRLQRLTPTIDKIAAALADNPECCHEKQECLHDLDKLVTEVREYIDVHVVQNAEVQGCFARTHDVLSQTYNCKQHRVMFVRFNAQLSNIQLDLMFVGTAPRCVSSNEDEQGGVVPSCGYYSCLAFQAAPVLTQHQDGSVLNSTANFMQAVKSGIMNHINSPTIAQGQQQHKPVSVGNFEDSLSNLRLHGCEVLVLCALGFGWEPAQRPAFVLKCPSGHQLLNCSTSGRGALQTSDQCNLCNTSMTLGFRCRTCDFCQCQQCAERMVVAAGEQEGEDSVSFLQTSHGNIGLKLHEIANQEGGHTPKAIVVCLKYGAEAAAAYLKQHCSHSTVVWLVANDFDDWNRPGSTSFMTFYTQKALPIINGIMQSSPQTQVLAESIVSEVLTSSCRNDGGVFCSGHSIPIGTWQPAGNLKVMCQPPSKIKTNMLHREKKGVGKASSSDLETKWGGDGPQSVIGPELYLRSCDILDVQQVQSKLEGSFSELHIRTAAGSAMEVHTFPYIQ